MVAQGRRRTTKSSSGDGWSIVVAPRWRGSRRARILAHERSLGVANTGVTGRTGAYEVNTAGTTGTGIGTQIVKVEGMQGGTERSSTAVEMS